MNYHHITVDDMLNGEGLRTVIWVSGCPHHCKNCHNAQTWSPESGIPFDTAAKAELFSYLSRDYIEGITFSGGDPLAPYNRETVGSLIAEIRRLFPDKNIWLYTGYLFEEIADLPIVSQIDVIVDGPYVDAQRDTLLHWKGSANQRVIDVQKTLETGNIVLSD